MWQCQCGSRHNTLQVSTHLSSSSSYRLNSCGLQAFSVLGLRLWNSLPRLLCDTSHSTTSFGQWSFFEDIFLSQYQCIQHIRGFGDYVLDKSTSYLINLLTDEYSTGELLHRWDRPQVSHSTGELLHWMMHHLVVGRQWQQWVVAVKAWRAL